MTWREEAPGSVDRRGRAAPRKVAAPVVHSFAEHASSRRGAHIAIGLSEGLGSELPTRPLAHRADAARTRDGITFRTNTRGPSAGTELRIAAAAARGELAPVRACIVRTRVVAVLAAALLAGRGAAVVVAAGCGLRPRAIGATRCGGVVHAHPRAWMNVGIKAASLGPAAGAERIRAFPGGGTALSPAAMGTEGTRAVIGGPTALPRDFSAISIGAEPVAKQAMLTARGSNVVFGL